MRPIFEKSDQTVKLIAIFEALSIGQSLSFAEASTAVGFTVTSGNSAYQSAKRIAERDHGIVIEGLTAYGFKRLNGIEMVGKGFKTLGRIRRAARRGAVVTEIAVRQNLPAHEMKTATEQLSRFRIIETTSQQTRPSTNKPTRTTTDASSSFDAKAALRNLVPAGATK